MTNLYINKLKGGDFQNNIEATYQGVLAFRRVNKIITLRLGKLGSELASCSKLKSKDI